MLGFHSETNPELWRLAATERINQTPANRHLT